MIKILAMALGALAAVLVFQIPNSTTPVPVVSLATNVASWCLGRRSKAQRLAYWRERTGLTPVVAQADDGTASVTFNKDVAPILFEHCAGCHRPGEIAPFSVLSFAEVRPWAWLIGVVTATRYMPPWPPETDNHLRFEGERVLPKSSIDIIQAWIEQGAQEGDPDDLPELPPQPGEWSLGPPDVVVEMAQTYQLPADAEGDIYRNFVLPVPLNSARWVRAVEIQPGAKQVVHHAIMQIDRLGAARRLDEADDVIGFDGMDLGAAENPGGHFIGWSPGKEPTIAPKDMPWRIEPGTDLVLQLHMLPTGNTDTIRPKVGLYFTDQPALYQPFGLFLRSSEIDIPPGDDSFVVEQSLTLPVDATALGVFPHAHYIGRDVWAGATLPDGEELTLIHIKHWDFGWQDEYRYQEPVTLPAGTHLRMRFTYDNSADNPRNPSTPPKRVVAGNRSTDEMAILMLQILPDNPDDEPLIREAVARKRIEDYPGNWSSHNLLGIALRMQQRHDEAIEHFLKAKTLSPDNDNVLFNLGNAYQARGETQNAIVVYQDLLRQSPEHPKVHNNYAIALVTLGRYQQAADHFRAQIGLTPQNLEARFNLAIALRALGDTSEARTTLQGVRDIDPSLHAATLELADLERDALNHSLAQELYETVLSTGHSAGAAHLGLGLNYLAQDDETAASHHLTAAIEHDLATVESMNDIAWSLSTNPNPGERSPRAAIVLASLTNRLTGEQIPEIMDTLAAAYAADARFTEAQATMRRAIALLPVESELRQPFSDRLSLYSQGQMYVRK